MESIGIAVFVVMVLAVAAIGSFVYRKVLAAKAEAIRSRVPAWMRPNDQHERQHYQGASVAADATSDVVMSPVDVDDDDEALVDHESLA